MIEKKIKYAPKRSLMSGMSLLFCTVIINAASVRPEATSDQSAANAGILLGIIALLLGIAALCLAVYILLRQNKIQASVSKVNDKIRKIESTNSDNSSSSRHDVEIDRLKRQLETLSDRISRISVSAGNSGQSVNQQNPATVAQNRPASQSANSGYQRDSAPVSVKKVYVSVLRNDSFPNASAVYAPGKTLYEIDTTDGVTGTIRFVDRKESVAIARRNLTQFVESVCLVQGSVPSSIDGIRTIRPER